MKKEHRARVTFSPDQVKVGLPGVTKTTDPAWLEGTSRGRDEAWSLICQFDRPPQMQGNPSLATVQFLVPDAPHERLQPGAKLHLFERATQQLATVEILD